MYIAVPSLIILKPLSSNKIIFFDFSRIICKKRFYLTIELSHFLFLLHLYNTKKTIDNLGLSVNEFKDFYLNNCYNENMFKSDGSINPKYNSKKNTGLIAIIFEDHWNDLPAEIKNSIIKYKPNAEKEIKKRLQKAIQNAIQSGFTTFISGMARGIDMWAAEIVIEERKRNPNIKLICTPPFEGFENSWCFLDKSKYHKILKKADYTKFICEHYSKNCFQI